MFKQRYSFTIIELIISIMMLSVAFLITYQLFQNFLEGNTKENRKYKFEKFADSFKDKLENNQLSFLISTGIRKVEYNYSSNELNYENADMYEPFEFSHIYQIGNQTSIDKAKTFFGLNKRELTNSNSLPYTLYFTNNLTTYKDNIIPYKKIYLIDFGILERLSDFNDTVRNCLLTEVEQNNMGARSGKYDLSFFLQYQTETNSTCEGVIDHFAEVNKGYWKEEWTELDVGNINDENFRKIILKRMKDYTLMKEINNFDLNHNIVKENLNRLEDLKANLNSFAKRQIAIIGSSENIDHFVYCFIDDDTFSNNDNRCRLNDGTDFNVDLSKIKYTFYNDWVLSSRFDLSNNDNAITMINYGILSTATSGTNPIDYILGTTGSEPSVDNKILYDFPIFTGNSGSNITARNFFPVVPPDSNSTSSPEENFNKYPFNTANIGFNIGAYNIFGYGKNNKGNKNTESLTEKITTSSLTLPFLFTNYSNSKLSIQTLDSTTTIHLENKFLLNKPIIKNPGGTNKYTEPGPYSAGILIVFPWILNNYDDVLNEELLNYGYGWVFEKVFSAK